MTFYALVAAVAAMAIVSAGCSKVPGTNQDAASLAKDKAAIWSNVASSGQAFVDTAASNDMFEVETSKLAVSKAVSANVKSFAAQMISAHKEATAGLKAAAAGVSPAVTPRPSLNSEDVARLDELKAKSGKDFDVAYAAAQVQAHQATLERFSIILDHNHTS